MCGIAEMFELDGVPASAIIARRMTETLAHRGPDGDGYLCEGPVALGHKRLAVIDLSAAGHQPMVTPDGRYAIVYNGEIFNFQELRAQLEALGHRFRSRTDTEVVLLAHAQWGTAAPERFNGMFAYALWDATTKSLLLVRDRYGIKPLYYAQCGQTLLFASEAKAVLCHPACRTSLDPEALVEYLTFQNILSDRTLFDGVRMLPPGSTLEARQGGVVIPRTYWDFQFVTAEPAPDPREAAVEVARLVRQAVTRQLVADVPITAYLSGGIDSGAIVAFASSQVPILTTITVGFDLNSASGMEIAFDERAAAEQLSYICKT